VISALTAINCLNLLRYLNAISQNDNCGDFCNIRQVFATLKDFDIAFSTGQTISQGFPFDLLQRLDVCN